MRHTLLIHKHLFAAMLVILFGTGSASYATADEEHSHHMQDGDLLLFPAILGTHLSKAVSGQAQDKLQPELDIFYSIDHERLRFLAEFLLRDDEQEMERLQLGWLLHPTASVWFGRFHSPLGFWNSQHHHGAYMQTTISRPSILAFEDESGVLPIHILGALAEGFVKADVGSYNYAFGIGRGPMLEETLKPVNILNPHSDGKLTLSGRLSYRTQDDASEFGAYVGHSRIPLRGISGLDEASQLAVGAFYFLETERIRFLAELFHVENSLEGPGTSSRTAFLAAYLQPEYKISEAWTVFGRIEATRNNRNDPYLNLYPEFIASRTIVGSRFDVARNQALKFEASRNERQDSVQFNQISLQWSMVYP